MTINIEDVKIVESERLTDEEDGGGRATGRIVQSGEINNGFNDLSRLDRSKGDVALRKFFLAIQTANSDIYLGAHSVVSKKAADPNVHVVLFSGTETDERSDARQRIESYLGRGAAAQWDLMGTQYEGQRQLVGFQQSEQVIPEVGEVYLIEDPDSGNQQYVRITSLVDAIQPFTIQSGSNLVSFERRRLDMGISAPLDFTFVGGEVRPEGPSNPHSNVFTTEVVDSARYHGASELSEAASVGDLSLTVASVYSPLVPSAQSETPLVDLPMGGQPRDIRPAAGSDLTRAITADYISSTQIRAYLIRPAVRGTLQLSIGGSDYLDDGSGVLTRSSGAFPFSTLNIEHDNGLITGTRDSGTGSGSVSGTATYMPGGVFTGKPLSLSEEITISNRAFNWIRSFPDAKPRPGTTVVSYMALGKWFELRDSGNGVLEGVGVGTVDFTTGTISITTDALPDIGTSIIFSFIIDLDDNTDEQTGTVASGGGEIDVQIDPGSQPGTIVLSYTSGSAPKSLTDASDIGLLAGDGGGTVDYATGIIRFKPDTLPDDGTDITVDYDFASSSQEVIANPVFTNGVISGTIAGAPLEPGSVTVEGMVSYLDSYGVEITRLHSMVDDGAGGFLYGLNSSLRGQQGVGTINYTTGAYQCELLHEWARYTRTYSAGSGYAANSGVARETSSGPITIYFQPANPSAVAGQTVQAQDTVVLNLFPGLSFRNLIPGSLLFTWAGETHFDRDGIIYRGFDSGTGAATAVGSINYTDRKMTLQSWPDAAPQGVDVLAAMVINEPLGVNQITFRTPGKPLRPNSMTVTITDDQGNLISELADVAGVFDGASVQGTVDVENGIVVLDFTDGVDPVYVFQDTGRYSAVLYTFVPRDAELIGLNPVRLPSDGRVPIFRQGDTIVPMHTVETDIGTPSAGQVVALSRDHQAFITVVDAVGASLDPAQYSVDKVNGTVTFEDPLTLETSEQVALVPPLTVIDRIEQTLEVTDVEITGQIKFDPALAYDFPADETVVSSALIWGDLNSRVFNVFTQRSWDSGSPNWTDERIGDDTTANYDTVNYPIEYANHGAITEKWAIVFTGQFSFDVVGESSGIIESGSTSFDLAPPNPNTGFPLFVLRAAGWGGGWFNGNVLRFDTEGCLGPFWVARTTTTGIGTVDDDDFGILNRGDAT